MTIVETSVWIDYINAVPNFQTDWLNRNLRPTKIGLTDLIFCEVLQGVRDDLLFARIRTQLSALEIVPSGGAAIALESAQNYRQLRTKGITIRKTIDCIVATVCIRGGHTLLHRDRDYDPFERHLGLRVVHPEA
ncbi:MAG: PIN domain nuclease [Acidobacteriaceae bacterium]